LRRQLGAGLVVTALAALAALGVFATPVPADGDHGDPVSERGDRYIPQPAGTKSEYDFWFGPYTIPPGHDLNRIDLDVPLANGLVTWAEPHILRADDLEEPSHQEMHLHHSHWFALAPGNEEDNYFGGNAEWIFGNGDEETRADFELRTKAKRNGPVYGQYIGAENPQSLIYMIHNKGPQPEVVYVTLKVHFIHGSLGELNALDGRPYHDVRGVLFGRTYDVKRRQHGDGVYETAKDDPRGPIEWTSTVNGTIIGTGGHLHPGGMRVVVENYGSKKDPCPDDGRGYGGTTLLASDAVFRNAPFSEDFQMEVTDPRWRAPIRKGDRVRISGTYENKKHSWYEVMTHEGLYIDTKQKPKRGCRPYLLGQSTRPPRGEKLRKVRGEPKLRYKHNTVPPTGRRHGWVDPVEGVVNRRWGPEHDKFCGKRWGGPRCERPLPDDKASGGLPATTGVHMADFLYVPGDRALSGSAGAPVQVKKGTSLTFVNEDAGAGIRHTATTCKWPCNGPYVANYPLADGVWDSGLLSMGLDPVDERIGEPRVSASTPPDLPVGKYAYFCRVHPWMRGAFEVVR
jgi:plastocyanin